MEKAAGRSSSRNEFGVERSTDRKSASARVFTQCRESKCVERTFRQTVSVGEIRQSQCVDLDRRAGPTGATRRSGYGLWAHSRRNELFSESTFVVVPNRTIYSAVHDLFRLHFDEPAGEEQSLQIVIGGWLVWLQRSLSARHLE